MAGTRRRYTEEFKREAVALTYSPGKTIKEEADDLGINRSMLTWWRSELKRLNETGVRADHQPEKGISFVQGAENAKTPA